MIFVSAAQSGRAHDNKAVMSRPLRLDHPGAVWHVTTRGNEKREIFVDREDRSGLLGVLADVVEICRWRLHAYVLMGNHYHLLLETPEANLSQGMHRLNGTYSLRFNRRHERVGHLFQGRFHAVLVDKDAHLLELLRYVVLNPVRAGLVGLPQDWEWSNYRSTVGLTKPPRWLEVNWTLAQFGGGPFATDRYRHFVDLGRCKSETPWVNLRKQVFLGGEQFRRRIQKHLDTEPPSEEVPWEQRHSSRPTLQSIAEAVVREFNVRREALLHRRASPPRMALAYLARREGGFRASEFALLLGIERWAASRLATQAEHLLEADHHFQTRVDKIRQILRKNAL